MKIELEPKLVFWITAVVATGFGLAFIFFPVFMYNLIGFFSDEDGYLMVRFFGLFVLGVGILTFWARNSELSKTREAIILMLFISYFLMTVTHLLVMGIRGPPLLTNVWLWLVVILHLTFIGIYGYFLIRDWKKVRALKAA
ncbi:MAG: hypothetical protein HeimAB125_19440 [Candidatus Heimdallarchaeota archaeon AB_125]|nr:MAG: hypothetical protein HeimAB125_19440 [Candidatus Heimdallarchaeota archaeon AB_125]